jgi:nicotinate-nucleotide adenylyltransferase
VATRPGYLVAPRERIEIFAIPAVDVSSTEVRRRVAAGEPIADLVPQAVAELIEATGVYRH